MLLLSLLLSSRLLFILHPFYVSITDIHLNASSKKMEINCRIFYDDLEVALSAEEKNKIDLINPKNRNYVDSTLSRYLKRHFKLTINGNPVLFSYLGYEIEEDVASCFLESSQLNDVTKIQLHNDLLYRQFKNQTNIMHIKIGKIKKSVKLDNPENLIVIDL